MKKTTQFRIKLFAGANTLAETIALLAAKSNGGKVLTIEQLQGVFDAQCILYPTLNDDIKAELIGGTLLHLDRKIGEDYKTVCVVELVELMEVQAPNEEEEMIGEVY